MSRGGKENFRLEQDQEVVLLLKGLFLQQKKMCLCLWQWRLKSMLCEFFSLANSQQQLLLYSSYRADVTRPLWYSTQQSHVVQRRCTKNVTYGRN